MFKLISQRVRFGPDLINWQDEVDQYGPAPSDVGSTAIADPSAMTATLPVQRFPQSSFKQIEEKLADLEAELGEVKATVQEMKRLNQSPDKNLAR